MTPKEDDPQGLNGDDEGQGDKGKRGDNKDKGEKPDAEKLKEENEKLKKTQEKIDASYKKAVSERDKIKNTFAKQAAALKEAGVADFDDEFNMTINVQTRKNDKPENELDTVNTEIQKLEKFIDSEEYDPYDKAGKDAVKKLSKLNARRESLTVTSTFKKEREAEKKKTTAEKQQLSVEEKYWQALERDCPGHNDERSVVNTEMARILAEEPEMYNGINFGTNLRERYLLGKRAVQNLIDKGKLKKRKAKAISDNFEVLDSGRYEYDDEDKDVLSDTTAGKTIKSTFGAEVAKSMNNEIKSWEKTGTLKIKSS